jgi:hypothetical protein
MSQSPDRKLLTELFRWSRHSASVPLEKLSNARCGPHASYASPADQSANDFWQIVAAVTGANANNARNAPECPK